MLDNAKNHGGLSYCLENEQKPSVSSKSFTSFIDLEEGLPGWEQEYLQLTTESFAGSLTWVDFGEMTIFRETVNQATINRFCLPGDAAFVSISLRNCAQALSGAGRLGVREGYLSTFKGEGECLNTGPVDFVGITFRPDGPLAEETHHWTALGAELGPLGEWLAALIGSFAGGHASPDLQKLAPLLVSDRLSLHLEGRRGARGGTVSGGVKLARDAMELLRHLPPDELSVKRLSQLLGHAPATLRATYRAHFDADLDTALLALRMSAARRKLEEASPAEATVSGIAADHGFLHWGRFAAAYRAMFGELPVATLRRSAAPSPAYA